jgi:quercetin dioxygenase-like cupin family protein
MGHTVVDVADIPYVRGTFKFVRHHLGATAFGFSQIDFPPRKVGSEHDEVESRQEVYVTLAGGGTLDVDSEAIEMRPRRYVLVPPERRPTAGPDGMSFLVIGGVPGGAYQPWAPPDE